MYICAFTVVNDNAPKRAKTCLSPKKCGRADLNGQHTY